MESFTVRRRSAAAAIAAAVAFLVMLLPATRAFGQPIPRDGSSVVNSYIPREIAMLPHYCIFTQVFRDNVPGGNDQIEVARWYSVMGPTFHHMHHYCYGLMNATRALLAIDVQPRNFYLRSAIGEFDYVLERTSTDFVLYPEILARKGVCLIRLGRPAVGLDQLDRATQIKPDYWFAYAQMSDYFKSVGDVKSARETLERGLSFAPESKDLKSRLAELDSDRGKDNSGARTFPKSSARP